MSDIDELLKRAEICDYDHTSCDALISDLAAALRAHVAMSAEAFATSECEAENDRLRLAWGAASTELDVERAARMKAETELVEVRAELDALRALYKCMCRVRDTNHRPLGKATYAAIEKVDLVRAELARRKGGT